MKSRFRTRVAGWRTQWARSRPVTVPVSASAQRSRWTGVSGTGGACGGSVVGTVMPAPPGSLLGCLGGAFGEVEEHLVQGRSPQGDVLHGDAGVGQGPRRGGERGRPARGRGR